MDTQNATPTPPPLMLPEKKESFWKEILQFAILALIVVLPIRLFVAQPYIVNGASMDPAFETGEYIIVDQLSNHFGDPSRGEVVVFKYPKDPSVNFIKRVIGLPGETLEIRGTQVIIFNKAHPQGMILEESYVSKANEKEEMMKITLKDDEYFVMGDNRRQSSDSRSWGGLPRENIVGSPVIRLFPFNTIDFLPGDHKQP